jgi:hypothetical protein
MGLSPDDASIKSVMEWHLRLPTRALIDDCWQDGGTIHFSAVSVWEIALLLEDGSSSIC